MTRTEMLETMKRLDAHANALLLTGASDIDLLDDVEVEGGGGFRRGFGERIEVDGDNIDLRHAAFAQCVHILDQLPLSQDSA